LSIFLVFSTASRSSSSIVELQPPICGGEFIQINQ
jgi:hypothetical protein